jgi:hypothetical protein
VSFKIFTKVDVNRLMGIAEDLISPTQTAFMHGRNIMEGLVRQYMNCTLKRKMELY